MKIVELNKEIIYNYTRAKIVWQEPIIRMLYNSVLISFIYIYLIILYENS